MESSSRFKPESEQGCWINRIPAKSNARRSPGRRMAIAHGAGILPAQPTRAACRHSPASGVLRTIGRAITVDTREYFAVNRSRHSMT